MKLHFVAFLVFHMVCFLFIVKEFGSKNKDIHEVAKILVKDFPVKR